jgi:hypothetical protein
LYDDDVVKDQRVEAVNVRPDQLLPAQDQILIDPSMGCPETQQGPT